MELEERHCGRIVRLKGVKGTDRAVQTTTPDAISALTAAALIVVFSTPISTSATEAKPFRP